MLEAGLCFGLGFHGLQKGQLSSRKVEGQCRLHPGARRGFRVGFQVRRGSGGRSGGGVGVDRGVIGGEVTTTKMAASSPFSLRAAPWLRSFAVAATAGTLFGYDIGATSSALRALGEGGYTTTQLAWVASLSLLGALTSSFAVLQLGNWLGRKTEIQIAFVLYIAGTLLQTFAPMYEVLAVGRVIFGLGIGVAMHAAPVLISESVPTNRRGSMVATKEAFIVAGILAGYVSGATFSPLGASSWRWMFAAAIGLEIPGLSLAFFIPESPRWLCLRAFSQVENSQFFLDLAQSSQCILNGGDEQSAKEDVDKVVEGETIDEELSERRRASKRLTLGASSHLFPWLRFICPPALLGLLDSPALEQGGDGRSKVSFRELLSTPGAKASLSCGLGLIFFQQFTGQPSVLYFANRIFEDAGLGYSAAIGVGVCKLLATLGSAGVVDRVGRRPLLVGGTSIMTACLAVLAVVFAGTGANGSLSQAQQAGIVTAVIFYVTGYQVGFGPVTWLMLSEIFPLRIRSTALAIGTVANFGSNLAVAALFEPIREQVGSAVLFTGFTAISLLAILFELFSVPETKGCTLEEIETMMRERELS